MQASQTFSHAPSVAGRYSDTERSSVADLKANVAATLCYVGPFGLVFFLMEKQSRLVRHHCVQALLYGAALIALLVVVGIVGTIAAFALGYFSPTLGMVAYIASWLVFAAFAIGAPLISMFNAYKGRANKLPVIGRIAERAANK